MTKHTKGKETATTGKNPEEVVLEDVVIPFLREDLGYKLIDPRLQRVPIRFGRATKYADTVVYIIRNARKVPYIVVETKAPNQPLDWEQAESYAQRLGAPYFLITDAKIWLWYQTGERQGESKVIPNAPQPPARMEEEVLIAFEDLNELSKVMDRCHDIIRNEEGFDPTIAFDEISKLLFAKMQDEREVEQAFRDDNDRTPKEDYEFKIGKDELPEEVGRKVKALFERARNKYREIFEGTSEDIKYIKLRFPTIFHVIQELQGYTLQETSIDIKGATYELFIKRTFLGRGLGQYFTPREIVDFMVDMVEPRRRHFILDPACGSGGFLITCLNRVSEEIEVVYRQRGLDNPRQEKLKFATQHLYGMDLNERMTWVAKMNMVMHGDGHGGIFNYDGFLESERVQPVFDVVNIRGGFDIILTNPPFGSKIRNQKVLAQYQLGRGRKTQLTEVLFIERCLSLLKPEGVLGIVVPDGILSNSSLGYVREFTRYQSVIKAVVSLPVETFQPYGSGVKPSLLFLQKKDDGGRLQQGDVFMAVAENIGYDATGRPAGENDLNKILDAYHDFERL